MQFSRKNSIFAPSMSTRRDKNKPKNTLNKQLEQPEVRGKEKNENLIQLGKFFYSLAGMTYAGVILTVMMDSGYHDGHELFLGFLTTIGFAFLGWILHDMGTNN